MYTELISRSLSEHKISFTPEQSSLLSNYLAELLRVNEFINLTAITVPEEAVTKNVVDCALCARYIPKGASVIDIGSGGGLPAFPFAILRPDINLTALDSTGKKVKFINDTAALLGLSNLHAVCGRAEELARKSEYRERFDCVSARAVARMNILSELCIPFLSRKGLFIAMKSRLAECELAEAKRGISMLGGKVEGSESFFLVSSRCEELERNVILIRKEKSTPEAYPRPYAKISSRPL